MIFPIVMAGGTGSRLWPLSRELYPKQFLKVAGNATLLQQTLSRLGSLNHTAPIIICNEEHRFIVAEQLRSANVENSGIILEPVGRNTAPAIALGALHAIKMGGDPLLLVMAADHMITNEDAFITAINKAVEFAEYGRLVTFGICPIAPETGYGYIKCGMPHSENPEGFVVEQFVEKPNAAVARRYIESGDYYWNSGIFLFKASVFISELGKFSPDIIDACKRSMTSSMSDSDFVRIDRNEFEKCPADSIDYSVMERTELSTMIPMAANWSDVGSWSSLWEVSEKDENSNVKIGDIIAVKSSRNYLHAENRLVTAVGIKDLIVVETKDAILVADRFSVQDVKLIVDHLKQEDRVEHKAHREVYRPWGMYDIVDVGNKDRVRRITVKPGEKISLQIHRHRAEHWVVVSGTAGVTIGDKVSVITEGQSTYIPVGEVHSLENLGGIPLEIIEVQTGSYLAEDDIVRFEDQYSRLDRGKKRC
ncbi:mannose-1-phosphate guanylyltransferase/mannose-6-phosphate isomerase [Aeromonas allosaccharophila]|uniref:mannose-1-phosphate guanylyltransferase/mannose-6-phosphate isomerase n=1 Tax=Aeromonas allosaccharophila TaxID=656 RepID=UPI001F356480|nr:mannose-1-phosphate guanylyltransferase/mannose-6-phosphate isomerase [Aeromonas allosaccharophila]MCE9850440.1 mannose-1-phosphate guanylyltransferase/mannose-6-phosphate isomerase [Aeromonas allosaccharophila]